MASFTGAHVVAVALRDLGVTVIFGVVGIPVVDIAEEAINLGIRFIGLRNEQACSYAASAYGFITGNPGVCLLVGGPGVVHGLAGISNCSVNAFPALFLAGSSETNLAGKGAFQELDAVSFLGSQTKLAVRPCSSEPHTIAESIRRAYHACRAGRPGPSFVDLPADLILDEVARSPRKLIDSPLRPRRGPWPNPALVAEAAELLKRSASPLVIIGKGAAYARAEDPINKLVSSVSIPFLPTPMGKGVIADDSRLNASSARSIALKEADVIVLLGARLNWILHFGEPPKFRADVKIIHVDICAEELGRTNGNGESHLGVCSDIGAFAEELHNELQGWGAFDSSTPKRNLYMSKISAAASKNEATAQRKALAPTKTGCPLTYHRAFHIIKETLHSLSPPEKGNIVYVSEGANTMDISRSIFPLHHPRLRLDAGTNATMGVGLGYSIAAYAAYNLPAAAAAGGHNIRRQDESGDKKHNNHNKKIVALEGDSALGFSAMEIETMQRHRMPILIYVINNSGVYHGDSDDGEQWRRLQDQTVAIPHRDNDDDNANVNPNPNTNTTGLRSTSLSFETRYDSLADMVGGRGFLVRTEAELQRATVEAYAETERVCVVNVIVESGAGQGKKIGFAWQQKPGKGRVGEDGGGRDGGGQSKL